MRDPNEELQQDTQEDIRYMESAEEHESTPSAGDEPLVAFSLTQNTIGSNRINIKDESARV